MGGGLPLSACAGEVLDVGENIRVAGAGESIERFVGSGLIAKTPRSSALSHHPFFPNTSLSEMGLPKQTHAYP